MKHYCILLLALLLVISGCTLTDSQAHKRKLNLTISAVDRALDTAPKVLKQKHNYLDSLLRLPYADSPDILMKIAHLYSTINNDSAIIYYRKAHNNAIYQNDTRTADLAMIHIAGCLSKSTMFLESFTVLSNIDQSRLEPDAKISFYRILGMANLDSYRYNRLRYLKDKSKEGMLYCADSLLNLLPEDNALYKIANAQHKLIAGDSIEASGIMMEIIESSNPEDEAYSTAIQMLADYYENRADENEEYLYFLALAAKDKLLRGDCNNEALLKLGSELFKAGDSNRAYKYMKTAGANIYDSKSYNLYSTLVPTMANMIHTIQDHESRMRLVHIIIYILGMAIILLLSYFLWKKHTTLIEVSEENRNLNNTIIAKDKYIGRLLDLCSVYVEGMEDFNKLVDRKLKANQIQNLSDMISSGKILKTQTDRFFEVFDEAVLNIYPNFISDLNSLLLPDKQLADLNTNVLTPDLRIVAFMRMGINDSSRLSKFLGLSLNTIYTYRNRMKSRAIDRKKFEEALINL